MDNELKKQQEEIFNDIKKIKEELHQVIVGQDKLLDRLLIGLICGGHLLVEGMPGLAKTLTIKNLGLALNCLNTRIQFLPDLLPSDITGITIYDPTDHKFTVKKGPIFTNLLIADEINRAPAKTQSALLEAMQENQVTINGETYKLPLPFLVMATQNPIEQEGTYPLPEAQLDRFMMKINIDHSNREEENIILTRMAKKDSNITCKQVADIARVEVMKSFVDKIHLEDKINDYILDIIFSTRPNMQSSISNRQDITKLQKIMDLIEHGSSPRGSIALTLCSKAYALLQNRTYVMPDDVKAVAPDVLRHRVSLNYDAEAEGITVDQVIQELLANLTTP